MMTIPTATNCQNGLIARMTSPFWMTRDDQRADDGAENRARAAEQRRAADHHRRDGIQQQRVASVRGAVGEARRVHEARDRRQHGGQHVDPEDVRDAPECLRASDASLLPPTA